MHLYNHNKTQSLPLSSFKPDVEFSAFCLVEGCPNPFVARCVSEK